MTWADLGLANSLDGLKKFKPDFLDNYPFLNEYVERIMNLPNIKAWIAKRPKTDY